MFRHFFMDVSFFLYVRVTRSSFFFQMERFDGLVQSPFSAKSQYLWLAELGRSIEAKLGSFLRGRLLTVLRTFSDALFGVPNESLTSESRIFHVFVDFMCGLSIMCVFAALKHFEIFPKTFLPINSPPRVDEPSETSDLHIWKWSNWVFPKIGVPQMDGS